ncbi:hypothetical protein ACVWXU_004261 [Streptomyces sp. TE33382]
MPHIASAPNPAKNSSVPAGSDAAPLDDSEQVRRQGARELRGRDLVRAGHDGQRGDDTGLGAGEGEGRTLRVPDHGRAPQPAQLGEPADVVGEAGERAAGYGGGGAEPRTVHGDEAHPECLGGARVDTEPSAGGGPGTQQYGRAFG